ncbi:MAG: V-type ATP synthase subunit D [Candidatus Diapherotrites archaeon]
MVQQNVKPTRMELLKLKKKIVLAQKGHKLLKEKRDALFNEFFQNIKSSKQLRSELEQGLEGTYEKYSFAKAQLGSLALASFAEQSSFNSSLELDVGEKNIMGVRVPRISSKKVKREFNERGYGLLDSSAAVDEAAEGFELALEKVIALSEIESTIMRLAFEIDKTKRKVNALEYNIIPSMKKTQKYIRFRLEEMEREKFFTLKKIKKKLQKKN